MNLRSPLESLWRKRLNALVRTWPAMRQGDVRALHRARVASRRIREALSIVAREADRAKLKKLSRKVRGLTRLLGPIRELDVQLGLVAELERATPSHRAAIELVRARIAAERKTLRDDMDERADKIDPRKLVKKLERLASSGNGTDRDERKAGAWRNVLAARAVRRAKRLREAIDHAGALYLSDRLHAVRIVAKKLRYILEVSKETGVSRLEPLIGSLKEVQETLGRLNDLRSLLDRVHEVEASREAIPIRAGLKAFVRAIEQECRRLHADFVVRREAVLRVCDLARHEMARQIAIGRPRAARVVQARRRHGAAAAARR